MEPDLRRRAHTCECRRHVERRRTDRVRSRASVLVADGAEGDQCPFRTRIEQWKSSGGIGFNPDGSLIRKPVELVEAEMIMGLCERFGCLPSQLLAEDAELLRYLELESMGKH